MQEVLLLATIGLPRVDTMFYKSPTYQVNDFKGYYSQSQRGSCIPQRIASHEKIWNQAQMLIPMCRHKQRKRHSLDNTKAQMKAQECYRCRNHPLQSSKDNTNANTSLQPRLLHHQKNYKKILQLRKPIPQSYRSHPQVEVPHASKPPVHPAMQEPSTCILPTAEQPALITPNQVPRNSILKTLSSLA